MSTQNPVSDVQDAGSKAADKTSTDQADPNSVPRSAVGVVNEAGEIVDKEGNAIGKVADSKDVQSLAGNTVTAAGDIIGSTGDIVGKAAGEEYTTENAGSESGSKSGGGFFGGAKSVFNTVGSLGKPVSDGVGYLRGGRQQKGEESQSNAEDTPAEDQHEAQTEAGSHVPEDAATEGRSEYPEDDQQTQQGLDEQEPVQTEDHDEQPPTEGGEENGGEDGQSKIDDTKSQIPDDATEAGTAADSKASQLGDEAKSEAPDVSPSQIGDEAKSEAPDATPSQLGDEAKSEAPDATPSQLGDEAKSQAPDVSPSQAGDVAEEGKDTAEEGKDAAEEGKDAAEETAEDAAEDAPKVDFSVLKGTKVNKAGKLVDDNLNIIGRLIEGDVKHLQGKTSDEEGNIWNDSGKIVGKAEPIPDNELDKKDFAPFENFPDAVVEADGRVTSEGRQVGVVVEGDAKRLKGSKVDEDGDILDRRGNVVGKAEAWDEPEPVPEEPEAEVDNSLLAGKRVNKAGYIVDTSGVIYGRVVEGNVSAIVGRMCNKKGEILSESGDVVGKAELVPEGEREGSKEGPFADLPGCTVAKDGKVVTSAGDVVGRITSGDPKKLFGRTVDDDGDVLDKNGNVLGKAERWEEPEPEERKKGPLEGRKVNKEGNVLDDGGNVIGKIVTGEVLECAGMEVDQDGDVMNSKGTKVGHVALIEDIPEPEPEPEGETEEEKEARMAAEKDKKLAEQLSFCIEQSLEKIKPITKLIMDKIDAEERKPKEERDEEELVKQVKPLIEEGGKILTETNGVIRGLDPDGRIQRNAKQKTGGKEASPEEYHLAEVLKELTGNVTQTIDNAKRKIEGMPHAKKELSPLWGLLGDPLVQILAAVGLLLNGVLGLVGKLLSLLGLGGIVDSVLGSLGINKLLNGLGLGSAWDALTNKNNKKK